MLVIIEAELIYRPDGSFIKVPAAAYSARVRQLEAEGRDTSDAQGIADAEFLAADRLQNESPKQSPKPIKTPPSCDGWPESAECLGAVSMIGSKGYAYCSACGPVRRASGYERVRKMTPTELRKVLAYEPLASYKVQS